jgi:hypothetical protein
MAISVSSLKSKMGGSLYNNKIIIIDYSAHRILPIELLLLLLLLTWAVLEFDRIYNYTYLPVR